MPWAPFGCPFWEDLASLGALGLKIVPGFLKVTLFYRVFVSFRGFGMPVEDLFRSNAGILA